MLPGEKGPNRKAGDDSDPKETREQAREGNAHTYITPTPHPHTHGHYSSLANKGAFLFSCCVAESESTAVHMVEEMSLLQETVEQSRAAEESSFIEPSFTHAEPPESKVRKVHTLKLCSLSKHVVINCVWYKFCCQIPFKLDFNVALKCTQIVTSLLFYTAKKTQKPS